MSAFFNSIKSFVHSISTNDHYASYDPTRPHGNEDTAPLASNDADRRPSSSSLQGNYVPGMRSAQMASSSRRTSESGLSDSNTIPLSDLGPVPSPELSWGRIDAWIESNYPELYEQLMEGATQNDLNDLEHDLDCVLPPDVRESLSVHDGQERGGKPTGLFFGITLLDMESISEEWNIWRRTAIKIEEMKHRAQQKAASSSSVPRSAPSTKWIENQTCCPPETVQPVYAHTAWVPLAKDFDGNNIGIDLAPGPKGRCGQVILFGREFDTKYVVAQSWGDFLAQFAADLESGQSYIDDDIENAVFAFKSPTGHLVSYFNVMRHRVERTQPKQPAPTQPLLKMPKSRGNGASVSQAPVNSGRPTQRLVSPTGSSTSLVSNKDSRQRLRTPSSLANQLNEVDLSDNTLAATNVESSGPSLVNTDGVKAVETKTNEAEASMSSPLESALTQEASPTEKKPATETAEAVEGAKNFTENSSEATTKSTKTADANESTYEASELAPKEASASEKETPAVAETDVDVEESKSFTDDSKPESNESTN